MAHDKHTNKDREKAVDLPPKGPRNPDPLTDAPGSHPIEAGVGAALGGAAAGAIAGAAGGPLGVIAGAVAGGGLLGGLGGKAVGELIDPTTEEEGLRAYYESEKNRPAGATHETYRGAYRYGLESGSRYEGRRFEDVETDLRSGWDKTHAASGLSWDHARGAVRHGFDRTIQLREERLRAEKHPVQTGEVKVRKEVVTEHRQINVPVEREEVVIERKPAGGRAASGDIRAEEIRIPVKEEKVDVHKETVVKEEVSVGKRKVQDTQTVSGDVKKEELRVEERGDVRVKGDRATDERR